MKLIFFDVDGTLIGDKGQVLVAVQPDCRPPAKHFPGDTTVNLAVYSIILASRIAQQVMPFIRFLSKILLPHIYYNGFGRTCPLLRRGCRISGLHPQRA